MVSQGASHFFDGVPDGVLPGGVAVGIEVFVDGGVGLFDFCVRAGTEGGVKILREVPSQLEGTVPEEVAGPGQGQGVVFEVLHVTLLEFIVRTGYVRVETDGLRQEVETLVFKNLEPLGFLLRLFPRFEGFEVGRPVVVERPFPVLTLFPRGGFPACVAGGVGIAEGEVCRVVGHRVVLGGDVESDAGQTEVFGDDDFLGNVFERVFFVLSRHGVKCLIEFHVAVERIVAGRGALFGVGIVDGRVQFDFFREEASCLDVGGDGVFVEVVVAALTDGFFQSAESLGLNVSGKVDGGDVAELEVKLGLRSPSAFVAELLQSEFVCPDFYVLHSAGVVAHANHHGAHFPERGVTHHRHFVGGFGGVKFGVGL